ncbi:MAG: hypothetical protein JXJ04_10845 [Spirochaetales bacterium]|nr:hypothetical protein [Spirochaetales bacterium]
MYYMFYVCLVAAFCYLFMGISMLISNINRKENIIFFFMCLSFAYWSFCGLQLFAAEESKMFFWLHLSFIGVIFFCTFSNHFIFTLTGLIHPPLFVTVLLYTFPVIILALHLFLSPVLFADVVYENGKIFFIQTKQTVITLLYSLFVSITFLLNIILLIIWTLRTKSNKQKQQGIVLTITLILSIVLGTLDDIFLPRLLPGYNSSGYGLLFFLIWMVGICWTIMRYKLLLSYRHINKYIVLNISDYIFLLNTTCKLIKANKTVIKALELSDSYSYLPCKDLIHEHEKIESELKNLYSGEIQNFACTLKLKCGAEKYITVSGKFSTIEDKYGDIIGILFQGTENKNYSLFKETYRLTNRELEIIQTILNGLTQQEAAELLEITERTVKYHVNNIYNKLGVFNRAQLYKIIINYNILPKSQADKFLL